LTKIFQFNLIWRSDLDVAILMRLISLFVSITSLVQSFNIQKGREWKVIQGNKMRSRPIEIDWVENGSLGTHHIQRCAIKLDDSNEFTVVPERKIAGQDQYGEISEVDQIATYVIQYFCFITNLMPDTLDYKSLKDYLKHKVPKLFDTICAKELWNLESNRPWALFTLRKSKKVQDTIRKHTLPSDLLWTIHFEEKNLNKLFWHYIMDNKIQISVKIQMRGSFGEMLMNGNVSNFLGLNKVIPQLAVSNLVAYTSSHEACIIHTQNDSSHRNDKVHMHVMEPYSIEDALYPRRFLKAFDSFTASQDITLDRKKPFLSTLSMFQLHSSSLGSSLIKKSRISKQSEIDASSVQTDDSKLKSLTISAMIESLKTGFQALFFGENSTSCYVNDIEFTDASRRTMLISSYFALSIQPAYAATPTSFRRSGSKKPISPNPKIIEPPQSNSIERCILQLLPLKNTVFRTLEGYVLELSTLRSEMDVESYAIKNAQNRLEYTIDYLDKNRRSLEPVFNEEDSAIFQIEKAERGERLIEAFRTELTVLLAYSKVQKVEELLARQKKALLALSEVGELMVGNFPYLIPKEGKFSFLPRLEGRCKVTFTFKRGNDQLGTCTILVDGYAAPITAGNFVDLSLRGFYSGLPVKVVKKKFGEARASKSNFLVEFAESSLDSFRHDSDQDSSTGNSPVQILGSYKEGFYDPLTAKVRRIPLELLKQEKISGNWQLSYEQGFTKQMNTFSAIDQESKPVLSFETVGLIAFNHGDKIQGSSEFFFLRDDVMSSEERKALDGQFTAFGFIIDGYDMLKSLKAGDIISETSIDEFGQQNLVKIRGTSFSDVLQKGSVIE
jgi:peptidylprolyl isomerase